MMKTTIFLFVSIVLAFANAAEFHGSSSSSISSNNNTVRFAYIALVFSDDACVCSVQYNKELLFVSRKRKRRKRICREQLLTLSSLMTEIPPALFCLTFSLFFPFFIHSSPIIQEESKSYCERTSTTTK